MEDGTARAAGASMSADDGVDADGAHGEDAMHEQLLRLVEDPEYSPYSSFGGGHDTQTARLLRYPT